MSISVWIGLCLTNRNDDPLSSLSADHKKELEDRGELKVDGLTLQHISGNDENAGFGVPLTTHPLLTHIDWKVYSINLGDLSREADELKTKVLHAFEIIGISEKPTTFFFTD